MSCSLHKQSRRFLQSIDDNFLTQVVNKTMRRGVLLDLLLAKKEGLFGDIKVVSILGCSDHEVHDPAWRKQDNKWNCSPGLQENKLWLFMDLLGGVPLVKKLEERGRWGVQEKWLIFNHHFLQTQNHCLPMSKKSSKVVWRPAWSKTQTEEGSIWNVEKGTRQLGGI